MKNIVTFLVLILIVSCKKDSDTEISALKVDHKTVINGHIENYIANDSIKEIKVFVNDVLAKYNEFKSYKIDSVGHFKIEIDLKRTQDITLFYNTQLWLLVSPGDQLELTFDGQLKSEKALYKTAKISGDNAKNSQLLFEYKANTPFSADSYFDTIKSINPKDYRSYHDRLFNDLNNFITTFKKEHILTPTFKDWLYVEKNYKSIDYLLSYPLNASMFNRKKTETFNFDDSFYRPLKSLAPLDNTHFVNTQLNSIGNYYLFYHLKKIRPNGVQMEPSVVDSIMVSDVISNTKDAPIVAQLALYDRIKYYFDNSTLSFYEDYSTTLDAVFKNSIFEDKLTSRYKEVKALIENPNLPENAQILTFNSKRAEDYLGEIIKNAKGKPIYIDNWATWCGPCKTQFKYHTPQFKEKYKGKVEFVYLCYQSQIEKWKPIIAEYNIEGKHYFVENEDNNPLFEAFNLEGFPTYVIINKDGSIVKSGFEFRPSEPETSTIIDALIQ